SESKRRHSLHAPAGAQQIRASPPQFQFLYKMMQPFPATRRLCSEAALRLLSLLQRSFAMSAPETPYPRLSSRSRRLHLFLSSLSSDCADTPPLRQDPRSRL